ncbi:F-box domain [Arabidopsis thaliana x Arabidopsis arenosa]|uniref:F-box domain n=1 Tax=Arabidopsis thaliana x Arabidopsis arenosa TaxID=1240361 RepID=A0A8T1XEA0_9BRAS|nr:F-box domain [Arabidopsis thaliana x Arabidopsis arenosa]
MPETTENYGGRIEEIVCEDRISVLPEDLLVTILLYVPTKEAVATMILSKRWLFIWTMLPRLDYRDNNDDEIKKSVWWFLEKSLQLHKAPVLPMLIIELGPQCPSDADVEKCVAKAVDHRVVFLRLGLLWSADPTSLPKTLYSCESLKILTLSDKILVDVPCTACLPSLRTLDLNSVVYKNENSLIRLLSSCPVLKSLLVKRNKDDNVKKFSVKVPSLLELIYTNLSSHNDVEDTGRCVVIDTPALTEFDFFDHSGDSCSIENTLCFEKVSIDVYLPIPDLDKFLRSFSAVLFLELNLNDEMILPWDSDWMDSLVPFLKNIPKLKCLIGDYGSTDEPPNASALWSESDKDPECLSSSLEKFDLIDYTGREEEKELVEYILTTSKCLKTATISLRSLPDLKLEDKAKMIEELKAIPRVSKTSQLLFIT